MGDWFNVLWAVAFFPLIFVFAGRMVRDVPDEYLDLHEQHPMESYQLDTRRFNLWFANRKNWPYIKKMLPRLFYAAALLQAAAGVLTVWVWKPAAPMAVTGVTALALLLAGLLALYLGAKQYERRH